MNKHPFLIFCLLFLLPFSSFSQTTQASLQNVTVYTSGAELNHSAKILVPSGSSEIVIKNLSGQLDENSIQVGSNTDVTILSVSFLREFLSDNQESPQYKRLQDSLKQANKGLQATQVQITIQQNALIILDANKTVGGTQSGLQVAELQKLITYYLEKQQEVNLKIQELKEKEEKQRETVTRIQNQINEQFARKESGKGELRLQVMSDQAQSTTFSISYLSHQAAWTPIYDLKAKDTKSPLKIIYKGNITQSTGLDWNKVKLSLSTNNPNQSGTIPILSSWFLNYYVPQNYGGAYNDAYKNNYVGNTVQSFAKAPIAQRMEEKSEALTNFLTTTENALSAEFDIDLDYDIPSDNKVHSVSMKEYEVPARYKYYSVPKLDRDVFLVAEIADWESLNLLPGMANIIFDGTYVGKSFIDPNSTMDTLNLSLGRDRKMVIKREKVQDYCSSKLIGGNRLHTVTYEITVRNTRKERVQLLLKDQIPLSAQKEIEVNVMEISEATRNEETGVLTWKLELAPNETKKVRIQYSVKFPKDKNVIL